MQSSIEVRLLSEESLNLFIALVLENELYLTREWPEIGIRYRNHTIKQQLREILESDDSDIWGVFIHKNLVGAIFIGYLEMNSLELGYFVSKQWSNRGVATAALKMLVNKFSLEGYTLRATINKSNISSIKVIEKAGFTIEERISSELIYCKVDN